MSASSGSGKRPREQASAGSSAPSSHKQPIWVWRLRADMQTLGMSAAQLQSLLINICKPLFEENRGSVSDVKYNAALVCAFPVMAQYQQHHQLTAAATAISDGSVSSSIQQQSTRPANLEVELHNFLFCEGAGKQRNSVQRRLKQLFSAAAAQTHDAKTFEALLLAHMMGTLKPSTYVEVANVLGQAPLHRALLAPAIQSRHGTDFRSFMLEAQFGTFRFTADDAQMHQRVRMGLDLMGPPTRSVSMRRSRATSLSLLSQLPEQPPQQPPELLPSQHLPEQQLEQEQQAGHAELPTRQPCEPSVQPPQPSALGEELHDKMVQLMVWGDDELTPSAASHYASQLLRHIGGMAGSYHGSYCGSYCGTVAIVVAIMADICRCRIRPNPPKSHIYYHGICGRLTLAASLRVWQPTWQRLS